MYADLQRYLDQWGMSGLFFERVERGLIGVHPDVAQVSWKAAHGENRHYESCCRYSQTFLCFTVGRDGSLAYFIAFVDAWFMDSFSLL